MNGLPTVLELFQAYYDCRKTKRNTQNALLFEERLERNLMELYDDLVHGTYEIGPSVVFVVEHPKIREIWAAGFRDRIVHHLVYNRIADGLHRRFINDSFACIPGKGTLAAVARIEHYARSVTQNHTKRAHVLQMDVANFFASIDRQRLDDILSRHVAAGWWLDLCRMIIHHDPTADAVCNSPAWLMRRVPDHKSLFNSGGKGLPIGNLSSQFLANVYLNELDQYAKHSLKARRWVRYVDDMVVFDQDPQRLLGMARLTDAFLQNHLGLALHPNKTSINLVERGFNALGSIIRPHARYVRRSTVRRGMAAIRTMCDEHADPLKIAQVANSYFAILRHANAYGQRAALAGLLRSRGHLVSPKLTRMFHGVPA